MRESEGSSADRMSQSEHLSPGDLAGFLDRDLDTTRRQRVEAHLDSCWACRHEAAEVARMSETAFAAKGIERRPRRWLPLVLTGALAAGLAGVALVRRSHAPDHTTVTQPVRAPTLSEGRARIGSVSPADNATTPARAVRFTWRALAADFYRISVLTESGAPVWTLDTSDTSVTLPTDLSLRPGEAYFWRVDAISAGISATTGSHRFQVAR